MRLKMGRAELRRAKKIEEKRKTATYNLTKAQLDDMVEEAVAERINAVKKKLLKRQSIRLWC
jgi:hypothetical protein